MHTPETNTFQPIRIRAYLQSGVISDQFLPLDSILYYHLIREHMGEKAYSMAGESNVREGANITLPLKKGGPKNEAWFYHCSFAQWPEHTIEDQTFYVKRLDLQYTDLIAGTKKIETARGRYKPCHIDIFYRHALYVDWYAVGVPPKLESMLRFCTHLGKKTAQGWGSVLKWEITPWPEDWSVRGPGNKLMRSVPILGDGFMYGVRPSYWNPRHQFSCKMPV